MDITIYLIAISLALDCFAISICISASRNKPLFFKYELPFFFGFFQTLMTIIGFYIGSSFKFYIENFDHWIAFLLLIIIGVKMIHESFQEKCEKVEKITIYRILMLSIATSIDSLVIGIVFSFIDGNIFYKSLIIGAVAFLFSFIGIILGRMIKTFKIKFIEMIGGIVLICFGIRILISHLF